VQVPDALAIYREDLNLAKARCLYQVKYSAELLNLKRWKDFHPALRAASRFAKNEGWEFRIAMERDIRGASLDNIKLLFPFRDLLWRTATLLRSPKRWLTETQFQSLNS
jgi:hypothetical protein